MLMTSWSLKFGMDFLISWQGLLQGFIVPPWVHFRALYHMKPQRQRSGRGRLGSISSSFHVHGKGELLPVSDECWMVHQDSWYACPEWNQFDVFRVSQLVDHHVLLLVQTFLRSFQHLHYDLGRFVVRCGLWMGWELWRPGLEAQTWFRHGVGWLILLSCTQGGEFISTTIAVSGKIGWCSTISTM